MLISTATTVTSLSQRINLFTHTNARKILLRLDAGLFSSFVKPEIDKGYPVLWSVYDSTTYDDHTTAVTGYKIYTKTLK
ncbi:MAG: hypothetical protein ACI4F5_05780 [Acutalibacteraceae bacterium]